MSEHRCHVLPLPLDERWFTTKSIDKREARQSLGLKLPPDVFLMGTVGRLDAGKGQRDALHALGTIATLLPLAVRGGQHQQQRYR